MWLSDIFPNSATTLLLQIIECLKENKKQLSTRCHQRVFKLQETEMMDPELDYTLMRVCKQMIKVKNQGRPKTIRAWPVSLCPVTHSQHGAALRCGLQSNSIVFSCQLHSRAPASLRVEQPECTLTSKQRGCCSCWKNHRAELTSFALNKIQLNRLPR